MKIKDLFEKRMQPLGKPRVVWIKTDGYEYRVPSPDGRDEAAYFTTDKEDAIVTAKEMHGSEIGIKMRSVPVIESTSTKRKLNVPEKHQLKIARSTLKMSDAGAIVMGGMTKEEAKKVIKKLSEASDRTLKTQYKDPNRNVPYSVVAQAENEAKRLKKY